MVREPAKAAKATEEQLCEARKQRKDTNNDLQVLMNRISFLQSEEAKLDRDIENMRARTRDLLNRKAEKAEKVQDDDVAVTAKDILGALQPLPQPRALQPIKGRPSSSSEASSQGASARPAAVGHSRGSGRSVSSEASTSAAQASALPPRQRSASAQRTAMASGGSSSSPARPGAGPLLRRTSSSSESQRAGAPPLPPLASTSSSRSLPASAARARSRPGSCSSRASSCGTGGEGAAGPGKEQAGDVAGGACRDEPGMALLSSDSAPRAATGSAPVPASCSSRGANLMHASGGAVPSELDREVVEELIHGADAQGHTQLEGLQQFRAQPASRVVHVRTASVKSHGVGWGLGSLAGAPPVPAVAVGVALAADKREAAQVRREVAKKKALWGVRKTFGLEPTPLKDASASVTECGAGAWS